MDLRQLLETMRTRTAFVLFLTALVVGGMVTFAAGVLAEPTPKTVTAGNAPAFSWRDFGPALDEAKAAKKPLVVSVYTDWCGWCKRMDKDTYTNADVRTYLDANFIPVKLNAEANTRAKYKGDEYTHRQIASGLRVTGYPTTLFLDTEGTPILTAPGYMNARDYLTVLRFVGEGAYKTASFDEFKKANAPAAKAPAAAPAPALAPSGSR
jgi:thioredoxin-related protein